VKNRCITLVFTDSSRRKKVKADQNIIIDVYKSTSKSTQVGSWLAIPLDQNWATDNSKVKPPSTGKLKFFEAGEEKVTTPSHLIGRFSGQICHILC
jgi:hypothetical protein